jgi:Carboxypeptidase regulatory-like domain
MHGVGSVRARVLGGFLATLFLLVAPAIATAQSAFSGVVRDTSGAVLPGVTVEASSPVLIEKVRTVVSDGEGRYSIVDLRPGTYAIVFTLAGFNAIKREGIELPSNFTMTINSELRVGALEETITVTGDAPVVDVQSTQRTHVLNRELLDSLPTGRNYSGLAALMPGVRMSNTDVGGNQQMEQIYMRVHGSRQTDTTLQVDGMQLNSLMSDGQVQAYYSDAANAEVSYQTSGVGADVSAGGLRINMIPKEGGNRVSGSAFAGGINESWQGDNITDELRARGVDSGDTVQHVSDYNFAIGGPIRQDRLWYFSTIRRIATNEVVAQNFYKDGRPGVEDQWIYNLMGRLTWQVNSKTKLTSYFDRYPKFKGHEMGALTDPETAARRREWEHALYYTTQTKATSTLTSRLLLEGGYSSNVEYYTGRYQPGIEKTRGTPEWFTQTGHEELVGYGTVTPYRYWNGINTPANGTDPRKHVLATSLSYVTGTHAVKTGVQWGFGPYITRGDLNGDLIQLYRNGVFDSVRVYNTPRQAKEFLNADLGIFAQDSWRIQRLTVNYGIRLEYFNGEITQQNGSAGRFVPERHFEEVKCMPCWTDVTPRVGVAYDLFGNARTAIKASVNRYMAGQTLGFAQRYNPFSSQSDVRTWTDANNDDVAQDSEIGPSNNARFGQAVLTRHPDPDIGREYDWEYSAGIQHELLRGVSVTAAWYHRDSYNMTKSINGPFTPADYTVVNVVSPLDGSVIPAYNLDPNKRGLIDRVDVNSTDHDQRSFTYTGFELGTAARLGRATLFGGWTIDRTTLNHCDELENWGNLSAVIYDASTLNSQAPKADYHFCNQSALGLPFLHEFKLSGSYQLPWQLQVNAAFQSYSGAVLPTRWSIGRTTRYALDCTGPCTPGALVIPNMTATTYVLDLRPPGTDYYERLNQLDLGVRKIFRIRGVQYSGQMDLFNATNSSYVKSQTTTYGPSLGQVLSTLQPITMRLAVQMRF